MTRLENISTVKNLDKGCTPWQAQERLDIGKKLEGGGEVLQDWAGIKNNGFVPTKNYLVLPTNSTP